jgi:hypothetical protein
MSCTRCGSDKLFRFEASKDVRIQASDLPVVCRACGQMMLRGEPLAFPPELEQQAKGFAELAEEAGKAAVSDLEEDPGIKIAAYFSNVAKKAYLEGFFRAVAFFRSNPKEGRIKRLRDLWAVVHVMQTRDVTRMKPAGESRPEEEFDVAGPINTTIHMGSEAFEEFNRLLLMGPVQD